jgi:DNA-binding NarL/FixJ family response regulator
LDWLGKAEAQENGLLHRVRRVKSIYDLRTEAVRVTALTCFEYRKMRGLLAGKCDKEIADDHGTNANAVKSAFRRIARKTGARTRIQLVIWAYARPEDLSLWP